MAGLIDGWQRLKKRYPLSTGVASVLPITGQVAASMDYTDAMQRGSSVDASMAAANFIPGIKLGKYASALAPTGLRLLSKMNPVERGLAPLTKNAPLIGQTGDASDVGGSLAQTYNNTQIDPVTGRPRRRAVAPLLPIQATLSDGSA